MKKGKDSKKRGLWFSVIFSVLLLSYAVWWVMFVFSPFTKRKDALERQIVDIESEIFYKKDAMERLKEAEDLLFSSKSNIQVIRAKLPRFDNLERFIRHLELKGREFNLLVEEALPSSRHLPSPYPCGSIIHPTNMTLRIKGDFLSIGKFIQSIDEEARHFCQVRNLTMERIDTVSSTVLAQMKIEVFCQKNEGDSDEVL